MDGFHFETSAPKCSETSKEAAGEEQMDTTESDNSESVRIYETIVSRILPKLRACFNRKVGMTDVFNSEKIRFAEDHRSNLQIYFAEERKSMENEWLEI